MAEMLDFEEFKRRYQEVPVEEYPNQVRETVPDPLLTVHLITYNHADYIRKAIESVLMQEVDFPMEIVLGDDDSSDGTREICVEYAEKYPDLIRLQLHHRENNHSLYGRPTQLFQYWYNTLNSRGKYIAVLSGDDYWTDPCKLEQQVSFLEAEPEYCFTHHNAVVVDGSGGVKEEKYFSSERDETTSKEELVRAPLVVASSAVFKNVFSSVPKIFMKTIHEDRLVTSTLSRYGKAKYFEGVKSAYRKNIKGIYDSSSEKVKYLDKRKYLNIIHKNICTEGEGKKRVERDISNLDKFMYTRLVVDGEYALAIKASVRVFVSLVVAGRPGKAIGWFFRSCRFLFGDLRKSAFSAIS